MKLFKGLEPTAEILGPEQPAGAKSHSADLFSTTLVGATRAHQTFRTAAGGGQLPCVVIPAEFDVDDFFATIATYYPSQSPLTAHVHVLGRELVDCFSEAEPDLQPDTSALARSQMARLGASLGETALAALSSTDNSPTASYSACKRSLAYALGRTVALYPSFNANIAVDRWVRLRRLTGLAVSQPAVRAVNAIHNAASESSKSVKEDVLSKDVRAALAAYIAHPERGDALHRTLLEAHPGLANVATEMEGPFDGRMGVFLKAVEEIQRASRGAEADSLTLGYFCNLIQPGSFIHSKVLARLSEFFPTALVWYGAFCTMSAGFDARAFGNGLITKLARDISQPFSFAQRPQCDLSLDELEVLNRAPVRVDAIKPIQQKIAAVALLPGVDVFARFAPEEELHSSKEPAVDRDRTSDERLVRASRLLNEAVSLLHELNPVEGRGTSQTTRRPRKK